ncbi:hypothetical protein [Pseudomonas sp. G(2018)]|uniref:hypothetical protein n=1 Tax=Pseudomonas sp. G(2018) TaxID=2502242 RepID=UPI0010F7EE83|nr:hypothetical protein [Pseudomonas sp. G(2018)]
MDIDTVVLYGQNGREEEFGVSPGSPEQVAAAIKQILEENPWAIRCEYESAGRLVDEQGVPLFDDPP